MSFEDLADLGKPQGFTPEAASAIAKKLFGLNVKNCKELPSERDRNFKLEANMEGRTEPYVLKFCNFTETNDIVNLQCYALEHLKAKGVPGPDVLRSVHGHVTELVPDASGRDVLVRCTTYIPGKLMSEVNHDDEFLRSLGEFVGKMDAALDSFWHVGAHRFLVWDLAHGYDTVSKYLEYIEGNHRRELVHKVLD
eukprot:gene11691-13805_t